MGVRTRFLVTLVFSYWLAASAQAPGVDGTVTGTVYCGSANVPARFASIRLITLEGSAHQEAGSSMGALADMRGEFAFTNVPSGPYAVDASLPGCISALRSVPNEEIVRLWHTGKQANELGITKVSVLSGQTTTISLFLDKGAVLEGNVLFEDNVPGRRLPVSAVIFPIQDGVSLKLSRAITYEKTDDRGHFRIAGLPSGIYTVRVQLPDTMQPDRSTYYLGNTADLRSARRVQVQSPETSTDMDIVIPVRRN